MRRAIVLSAILLATTAPILANDGRCDCSARIVVRILNNNTVLWNGKKVADKADLRGKFKSVTKRKTQPCIIITPDRNARYELTSLVLSAAQEAGARCTGFTGISQ